MNDEKRLAHYLYSIGISPCDIVERIAFNRAMKGFRELDTAVHHFLSIQFKKQMYPVEVYGLLENIEKEEKEDGEK